MSAVATEVKGKSVSERLDRLKTRMIEFHRNSSNRAESDVRLRTVRSLVSYLKEPTSRKLKEDFETWVVWQMFGAWILPDDELEGLRA